MIKKLRVTVLGKTYDVTVEMVGQEGPSRLLSGTPSVASASLSTAPESAPKPGPSSVAASPGDVSSPLAGKVVAVSIERGQKVSEGDQLITIEAMKMNTYVFAQKGGTITEIKVQPGDAVEEGQPLVTVA